MELNEIRTCELSLIGADGSAEPLALGSDYACRGFTGSGVADASVVFVGYGLSLPERGYDDYDGLDVRGKIVLAIKPPPKWEPADGKGWGDVHLPRPKSRAAREHGAAALLLMPHPASMRPQPAIASVMHGPGAHVGDLPQAEITAAAAARLCAGGLAELAGLATAVDAAQAPASRELPGRLRFAVEAAYEPAAPTANVVGVLPGSDPELRDECVVIGGHLDHVGRQGEVVWPGANDNASGAAAVLALARAFADGGVPPRRTVVFVLFAGEEQGLVGARWFVDHPLQPFERTIAMLNLDCVAHGDSIQLGGGELATCSLETRPRPGRAKGAPDDRAHLVRRRRRRGAVPRGGRPDALFRLHVQLHAPAPGRRHAGNSQPHAARGTGAPRLPNRVRDRTGTLRRRGDGRTVISQRNTRNQLYIVVAW